MSSNDASTPQERGIRAERGDQTREKLVLAAIDVFGRYGFDATTTRALAAAAGVNLQAIPYYFGGKEGLYLAVADHIASQIGAHIADLRAALQARFEKAENLQAPVDSVEARTLLTRILQRMAALFVSEQSESWARFMIREQIAPTEAFQRVYSCVMQPMFGLVGKLVAILLQDDPQSERVRLKTLSLVGSVLVFRIAHAATMAHLGWEEIGDREVRAVQDLAVELVGSIGTTSGAS